MARLAIRTVDTRGPASRPGPGRWVRGAILALVGVLLSLVVAEIALRVVQPVPAETLLPLPIHERRLRRFLSGNTYLTFDRTLGWVTTPKISQRVDDDTYRHNAAGLRTEREYAPSPPPGVVRVAAFGDSFTYCDEVELRECWTAQLEATWPGTEVLNVGVSGYGPDQAWLRYRRDGPPLRPCVVLIGYMAENVNRVVNRYRPYLAPGTALLATKPRFLLVGDGLDLLPNPAVSPDQLLDPAWVERAAGPNDRWYFPGLYVANPLDGFELVRVARTAAFRYHHGDPDGAGMTRAYRERGESFEITRRILIEHAREVRRDGAHPVVVMFPEASQVRATVGGEAPVYAGLQEALAREGVPQIDTSEALTAEARRSGVLAVIGDHYTPLGNRVVAEALARQLPELVGDATCQR